MIEFRNINIPFGMCRSVEGNNIRKKTHPVRDASLAGCKRGVMAFSTERCIPLGIRGFGKLNRYILFVFLIFSVSAFGQNDLKMLEKAYKNHSKAKLKKIFNAWSNEIQPITETELLTYNDTIQQAYKAFTAFYKPHRLDSICGVKNTVNKKVFFFLYVRQELDSIKAIQWANRHYKNVKYLIVQNQIKIYFTDKVYYTDEDKKEWLINKYNESYKDNDSIRQIMINRLTEKRWVERSFDIYDDAIYEKNSKQVDSVANFRPKINCGNKIPIYLTPKYDTLLNTFLGSEHLEFGTGGIMNIAQAKGESKRREKFLENYVKILHGHWGGYWHLCSFPKAYFITFDKDMEYARIDFRAFHRGGEAYLRNDNGKWTLISSRRRWIE